MQDHLRINCQSQQEKQRVRPDLKRVSVVPGMLGLVPYHLLLSIAILLWVQLSRQAADVMGEGLGGGLVDRGGAQLAGQTRGLRLNELALDDQRPRWRFCITNKRCCIMRHAKTTLLKSA